MRHLKHLILILVSFSTAACSSVSVANNNEAVHFDVLASGSNSGITIERMYVINNPSDWKQVWRAHVSQHARKPPIPEINFEQQQVIALFMGQRHTGGYAIEIARIESNGQQLVVHVRMIEPAKNAARTMALSQPYTFARIDKTDLPIVFVKAADQ